MAAKIAKASYDPEEDILYVRLGRPIKDSLQFGDFIVDFASDDRIVGLEIANASRNLLESLPASADPRKLLTTVRTARFATSEARGLVTIRVAFDISLGGMRYQPALHVPLPQAVLAR